MATSVTYSKSPLWRAFLRRRNWLFVAYVALGVVLIPLTAVLPSGIQEHPFGMLYIYVLLGMLFVGRTRGLAVIAVACVASLSVLILRPDGATTELEELDELLIEGALFAFASVTVFALVQSLRRAQQEMTMAKQRAEEALQLREGLVLAASHDVRSPLTVVKARMELMRTRLDAAGTPDVTWLSEQVKSAHAATQRMASTIDDFLVVAAEQAGQASAMPLRQTTVDMCDTVRSAADMVTALYPPAIHATIHIDAPTPCHVYGDRPRLERALENIIANAVKFSSVGQPVRIIVEEHSGQVMISVRDWGIGIADEDLRHVFTPFHRGSTAQQAPGIGLGLAGAKATIERHGGNIAVESTIGEGTCVSVSLPALSREIGSDNPN